MNAIIDKARKCYSILEELTSPTLEDEFPADLKRGIKGALALLREIDAEVKEASITLVMNKKLTIDQFYLLRALKVLTVGSNIEYENYLAALEKGTFTIDRETQMEATAAWADFSLDRLQ